MAVATQVAITGRWRSWILAPTIVRDSHRSHRQRNNAGAHSYKLYVAFVAYPSNPTEYEPSWLIPHTQYSLSSRFSVLPLPLSPCRGISKRGIQRPATT